MSDSVWPHRWQPTRLPCPWDSPGKNIGVGCHFLLQCMKVKSESEVAQSCPTLSDPMDCSPPGSSVHGIFQVRELEWGAIAFSISTCTGYQLSWKLHARQFLTSQSLNIWTSGIEHPKTDSIMDDNRYLWKKMAATPCLLRSPLEKCQVSQHPERGHSLD